MSSSDLDIPSPTLVIDGSGSSTFVGVLDQNHQWLAQESSGDAPLESLFPTVERILNDASIELSDIRAYIYAEGPGSVLGLRLCAMAIETWSRLYPDSAQLFAYNSLTLAAADLLQKDASVSDALIISDWKKAAWNAVQITNRTIRSCEPIATEALVEITTPIYHLPARKGWQKAPEGVIPIANSPAALSRLLLTPDLLTKTQGVELYTTGANTFQKWTPERHRAN